MRFLLATALAALALGATLRPAVAADALPAVQVTGKFSSTSVSWGQGFGDVMIAWSVQTVNGQRMLCGAYTYEKSMARRITGQLMRKAWVKVDDKKVLKGLGYFTDAGVGSPLIGVAAPCKPLPGTGTPRLGIDPGQFRP